MAVLEQLTYRANLSERSGGKQSKLLLGQANWLVKLGHCSSKKVLIDL